MAPTLPRGIANAALRCALVMRLGFVLFGIAGTGVELDEQFCSKSLCDKCDS
jgi:hypothetical protein